MTRFMILLAALVPGLQSRGSDSSDCSVDSPWILELQREDGSWDADHFADDREGVVAGAPEDDVAVTSLLLLAFLGEAHTSSTGSHQVSVTEAMNWLVSQEGESGMIGRKVHGRVLHHHALATLTLCENVYFGAKPDYSAAARKAIAAIEKAALPGGGWSASGKAEDPVDPQATAWAAMALRSAHDGELIESEQLLEDAASWFRQRCDPESGLFRASADADVDLKATLCGLSTRFFAGEEPGMKANFAVAFETVIESRPEFRADPEYYYLASVVAYQSGGNCWKVWNKLLKKTVLDMTRYLAKSSNGPIPVDSEAPVCGTLGSYAFTVLCLDLYFRYSKLVGAR